MKKILIPLLFLFSNIVQADFISALDNYNNKNYSAAYEEFYSLATIGDKQSQFNLGIMYFYGQHVPKDINKAYAWLKLSTESELATQSEKNAFATISTKISDKTIAEKEYQLLKQQYSTENLINRLYPELVGDENENLFVPKIIKLVQPKYPRNAAMKGLEGWVKFRFDIDRNGVPRNISLLESFPHKIFERASLRVIPDWKFENSLQVDQETTIISGAIYTMKFRLSKDSDFGIKDSVIQEYKTKIENGDAKSQYTFAHWKTKGLLEDEGFNPNELFLKSAVQGFPLAQYTVGKNLIYGKGCIKDKSKGMEWLTRSAAVGQTDALELLAILASQNENLKSQLDAKKSFNSIENLSSSAKLSYAWMLVQSAYSEILDPEKAIDLVESLSSKKYYDDITIDELKAAAYASMGKYRKAVSYQEDALDEAEDRGADTTLILKNLSQYKAEKKSIKS